MPRDAVDCVAWENETRLLAMLRWCHHVAVGRLVLAAADCVDIAVSLYPEEQMPRPAVERARRWVACGGPVPDAPKVPADPSESFGEAWSGAHDDLIDVASRGVARACRGAWPDIWRTFDFASRACEDAGHTEAGEARARMVCALKQRVPFSVIACSMVGLRDPLPPLRPAGGSP